MHSLSHSISSLLDPYLPVLKHQGTLQLGKAQHAPITDDLVDEGDASMKPQDRTNLARVDYSGKTLASECYLSRLWCTFGRDVINMTMYVEDAVTY